MAILHDTGSFSGGKKSFVNWLAAVDGVVVTTYASIRIYKDILLGQNWDYVILDEGHKIRNPDAEITIACKQVCSLSLSHLLTFLSVFFCNLFSFTHTYTTNLHSDLN